MKKPRFYTKHFPTHGCGAILDYRVRFSDKFYLSFWKGGYGNIPQPLGSWSLFPNKKIYRKNAWHFRWLNFGISFVFSQFD